MTTSTDRVIRNVLTTRERNGYDDSDFYAIFLVPGETEEDDKFSTEVYASTRWAGPVSTLEHADEAMKARAARAYGRLVRKWRLDNLAELARTPSKGKRVSIEDPRARTRPKSGEGMVFWTGTRPVFHSYRGETEEKVGVVFDDGTRAFYKADRVTVIDPDEWIDWDAVRDTDRYVAHAVANPSWVTAIYGGLPASMLNRINIL